MNIMRSWAGQGSQGRVRWLDLLQLIKKMQELPVGKVKGRGGEEGKEGGDVAGAYIILILQDLIL